MYIIDKKYLLLVIFIIFYGCIRKPLPNEIEKINEVNLIETEKVLELRIDNKTKNICNALFYYEANKNVRYLTFLNAGQNEIQFYNIDSAKLSYKVKLSIEGPNGTGKILGFTVQSLDSIYITSKTNINILYMVNREGDIIKKYHVKKFLFGDYIFGGVSYHYNPILKIENKLYLGVFLADMPSTIERMNHRKLTVKIDLQNDSIEIMPLEYPDLSSGEANKIVSFIPSRTYNGKEFIFNFNGSHNLYITKDMKNFNNHVLAKSRYINKKIKSIKETTNFLQRSKCFLETPHYSTIIYDKYREVYYRFVYPGIKVDISDDLMDLNMFKKVFSIMILNKDLEIIGETMLPENKYNMTMYFVAPEGLYLSMDHILNPDFDINYLKFKLFNIFP